MKNLCVFLLLIKFFVFQEKEGSNKIYNSKNPNHERTFDKYII